MKIKSLKAAAVVLGALCQITFVACTNEDSPIGSSIIEDNISVTIDSTFTISGKSVPNAAVQSRTLLQLLGRIDAAGYGSLSSDVVTQFMPSVSLDTTNVTVNDIDSIKLMMGVFHGNFVGDSVTPMGIEVYRLTKDLPSPIYSDFDPTGYYDPSQLLGSKIYNASTLGESDSAKTASYHTVSVNLPQSLAKEFFSAYKKDPADFNTPSAFIDKIFKGLYIRNSYGSGRLTLVSNTLMRVFYHNDVKTDDGRDSTVFRMANYFAVTPEIVTNNNIGLKLAPSVESAVENGENIVVSPTGYDVEFRFPLPEIIASYNNGKGTESAINSLTFTLPVDSVENKFGFGPAPNMLLVLKNKKDEFFQNNSLPDNRTSFYSTYDETNQRYTFAGLRTYLVDMLEKENLTADDYTFVLTPIYVSTESNGNYYYGTTPTVTTVTPYISSPTMTKILFDKAKIKLTFSNQTTNNL